MGGAADDEFDDDDCKGGGEGQVDEVELITKDTLIVWFFYNGAEVGIIGEH